MKYKIDIEKYKTLPKEGGHGCRMLWKKVGEGEVFIGLEKVKHESDKWHKKEWVEDYWLMVAIKNDKGVKIVHQDELE